MSPIQARGFPGMSNGQLVIRHLALVRDLETEYALDTRRAYNCAYVRCLLRLRDPLFAAQLEHAVRVFTCIHPGVSAQYPPNPTEHCCTCGADVPYTEL